ELLTRPAVPGTHAPVTAAASSPPAIRVRGRSFMALVLAPEPPVEDWLAALDAQIRRSPSFFEGRPVVIDLAGLPRQQPNVSGLIQGLHARNIRIIGTEGAHAAWEGIDTWGRPPLTTGSRAIRSIEVPDEPAAPAQGETEPSFLLVDHPIRSGQSLVFEGGDVTVVGSVASGAEVIAGGSIHIYGTLRGRAVAGFAGNARARVFCRRLEAELIAIDGIYRTADDMAAALRGRAAQAWLDGDTMAMAALD
ncbi:MAG TPA: septum site-determining protein MinC, partial [Acetobacteraceae bacterium]|nr:septum site-determining protein MinC [Acetobacteraceae bacterium]